MVTLRRRLDARDRGTAMVEMAIVAPLLALLVAGILEFGTLWRDNLTLSSSSRAAARVVSNLGDDRLADYEALLTLESGLASISGVTVDGVLIYDAAAADGAPDSSCFDTSGNPQGSMGYCNYYTAAQLASMSSLSCAVTCTEFPANADCSGGLTENFCPQDDRETTQGSGLTHVGVWVRIQRGWFSDMFPGNGVTITDQTVMRVEPK